MTPSLLHVFAINSDLGEVRHTHLTRAQDTPPPDLPDLATWLGVPVATDAIELFPVADLAPLTLTDYLRDAFDVPEKILSPHAARLSALDGHVLLIPDAALSGEPVDSAQVTAIASLPITGANQSQAAVPKMPEPDRTLDPARKPMSDARMSGMVAMAALAVLFLLVLVMVLIA